MLKKSIVFLFFASAITGCTLGPPEINFKEAKEETVAREKGEIVLMGKVYPIKEVVVTSPLSGRIERIEFKLDDYVNGGTPVIYFDTSALEADLLEARARLAKSRSEMEAFKRTYTRDIRVSISREETSIRIREAKTVFDNTKQKLERMRKAYKDEAVSKQELEGVENEYARAEAALKMALLQTEILPEEKMDIRTYQFNIMANQAEYIRKENSLRQAVIKAPISGFVSKIATYPGQNVFPGWELLKIVDIKYVKVEAKISPGLMKFVHPGQEVEVTINTVPPMNVRTKIDSVRRIADIEDQMCRVVTIFPNKDYVFQPGFSAKVKVIIKKGE